MMKKLVIYLLCLSTPLFLTHCTSTESSDEGSDEVAQSDSSDEASDEASSEEEEEVADNSDEEVSDDETISDSEEEDKVAESEKPSAEDIAMNATEAPQDQPAVTEAPPVDNATNSTATGEVVPPPSEPTVQPEAVPEPTPQDSIAATDATNMGVDPGETIASPPPEVKKPAELKKVKTVPFKTAGTLLNAFYIARQDDSWSLVSDKLGTDAKSLKKVNPYIASRELKVGDKIYYNSQKRPEDSTVIKSYYEDLGIEPLVYEAKMGDNIRSLGKDLLGHERSWMELWATNTVESKDELPEGTVIRYWKTPDLPATSLANTEPPTTSEEFPAAPSTDLAQNTPPQVEPAPVPEVPAQAQAEMNSVPPPPPPPQPEMQAPPPPPPQPSEIADANLEEGTEEDLEDGAGPGTVLGLSNDELMYAGGAALAIILLVVAMIVRNKKKSAALQEATFVDTNVGT